MIVSSLSPEEVELRVLSAIRTPASMRRALEAGLNDESWQVDAHAEAWSYIVRRYRESGAPPTRSDVLAATGVELIEDASDDSTFLDELIRRTIERQAVRRILEADDLLRTDPRRAVERLIGDLSEIARSTSAHSRVYDAGAMDRLELIESRADRAARGEVIGIRTGLPTLDSRGYVFRRGEMVCIQGPMNVGKSTLLLWFCAHAYYHDRCRILFLTPESTIEDVEDRLDVILGRFMGYSFSNSALRRGLVDMDEYRRFAEELSGLNRSDWITRDSGDAGVFTVGEIISLAREHRPDILAIDGVHLISGEGRTWERMKEAAEILKGQAQHLDMVVIGGNQVQRDAVMAPDDPAALGQGAYGLAFAEACNKVISLAEKRGDPLQRVWKLVKNRDGERIESRHYLRFDVDKGIIGELNVSVDDATGLVTFD
jgi:hypothetical protein